MGDVDEHPEILALLQDAPAEVGEPGRPAEGGERAEARRLRQSVVHEMGERQVAQTSRGEPLEVFQRALEVVPAFGRMDHRQAPGVEHLAHAAAWGQARSVGSAGAEILDELHRAHGGSEGTREGWHRRRVYTGGEHPQAPLQHARQIELLPQRVVASRGRPVLAGQVSLQPVRRQPRMGMQIRHRRRPMDLARVDAIR